MTLQPAGILFCRTNRSLLIRRSKAPTHSRRRFLRPVVSPPVAQWVIVGFQDDSKLGSAQSLVAAPSSTRESSLTHVVPPGAYPQGPLASLYPYFLRKRNTPDRHDEAADEFGKELLLSAHVTSGVRREFSGLSAEIRGFFENKDETGAGEETWTRMAAMAGFSLGGFGLRSRVLRRVHTIANGSPTFYAILQHIKTLCGAVVLRAPIKNRIAHAAAALTWWAISPDKPGGVFPTLVDCAPYAYEAYEAFSLDGGIRNEGDTTPDRCHFRPRCKTTYRAFRPIFGRGGAPWAIRSDFNPSTNTRCPPEVPPLHFLIAAWGEMTYRYISDFMGGTRRRLSLAHVTGKCDKRSIDAIPYPSGGWETGWGFPTTRLTDHRAGYWQSIAIHKMQGRISKSAWRAVLHQPTKPIREAGEAPPPDPAKDATTPAEDKTPPYPAGMPLRPDEIQRARGYLHWSVEGGDPRFWDPPAHAGRRNPESSGSRGRREIVKLRGLRPLRRMHRSRRGAYKSEKKVLPDDTDGFIQGLRLSLAEQAAKYVPKSPQAKWKGKSNAIGLDRLELSVTPTPRAPKLGEDEGVEGGLADNTIPVLIDDKEGGGAPSTSLTNINRTMGPAALVDPIATNIPMDMDCIPAAPPVDLREMVPTDLLKIDTTEMEEPARRLLCPDEGWLARETAQPPRSSAEPVISPSMEHLGHWCARSKIPIPVEIAPSIIRRMMSSMPEFEAEIHNEEWAIDTMGEALIFLSIPGRKETVGDRPLLDRSSVNAVRRKAAHGGRQR